MQKIETTVIDDITGEPGASNVEFSIDGISYEIDLVLSNYDRLVDSLAPFTEAARQVKHDRKVGVKSTARGAKPGSNREHLAAVRRWAREQGLNVSDRGRLSAEVMSKFEAAHVSGQLASVG